MDSTAPWKNCQQRIHVVKLPGAELSKGALASISGSARTSKRDTCNKNNQGPKRLPNVAHAFNHTKTPRAKQFANNESCTCSTTPLVLGHIPSKRAVLSFQVHRPLDESNVVDFAGTPMADGRLGTSVTRTPMLGLTSGGVLVS